MLQVRVGSRATTKVEIRRVELDYLLGRHTRTSLRIRPDFVEHVEDEILTNKDQRL